MYFPSKKDWWLWLIIWIAILLPTVMLIKEGLYTQLPISLLVALFVGWIWFGTGYTVTETELKIKSGPLRYRIPIKSITKIRKTRNPLSSPALSLDRLEVKYGKYGRAIISPIDKKGFTNTIQEKNPEVEIDI